MPLKEDLFPNGSQVVEYKLGLPQKFRGAFNSSLENSLGLQTNLPFSFCEIASYLMHRSFEMWIHGRVVCD